MLPSCLGPFLLPFLLTTLFLLALLPWQTHCMPTTTRLSHRQSARDIFYHGLDSYIRYAYPEDELRPLTCAPLTRDRANPAHIEVNDVLGNYSLSLVDSLSTLAILASSARSDEDGHDALRDFQGYVALLVEEYGDGTQGRTGQGRRARGFDLDSKVQLFETTIRGLGGLLSAHEFAMGDLPIRGYKPRFEWWPDTGRDGVEWDVEVTNGRDRFVYDGQLLRLAYDLGQRLLPAFHTPTGIPYPRVNLRTGIPFYENSPLNNDAENGQCGTEETPVGEREVTETCSAGAGSLVLEFTVLSRLTGDERFEKLAKKAFWAVWERRTNAGLIGSGIDAETGQWISPYTGIGAGIDSFFEYAFKSHILLSGLEEQNGEEDVTSSMFLGAWENAHQAIKRHIYRGPQFQHPHYAQNDMWTGGPRLAWIDSLSAYYPGLLALAGEIEEATSAHLLYTALWNRYGALPERWNTFTGKIDAGLRWWGGRPEFIESDWYLYRATKDPWYLHVGEMTLKDIKRRCWTPCGWAGLQDVRTGEQNDRMESFFLGETVKYLYLLFDEDHPLNHLDAPFVFTTEGHPLIIPKHYKSLKLDVDADPVDGNPQCPAPPPPQAFSISTVANRPDFFHAASLARLHETPASETQSFISDDMNGESSTVQLKPVSPNNDTYYPWTLPLELIPTLGTCSKMSLRQTFDLTFPNLPNTVTDFGALQRVNNKGILIKSVSGLRLALVLDNDVHRPGEEAYRIYALSNFALGRDEGIYLHANVMAQLNPTDPNLTRLKDTEIVDLIVDVPTTVDSELTSPPISTPEPVEDFATTLLSFFANPTLDFSSLSTHSAPHEMLLNSLPPVLLSSPHALADHLDSLADLSLPTLNLDTAFRAAASELRASASVAATATQTPASKSTVKIHRHTLPAFLPTGPGAAPLPSTDLVPDPATAPLGSLTYLSLLLLDSDLCSTPLPPHVPRRYQILIVRRGNCSFSRKLEHIPSYPPSDDGLKMVVVVSFPEHEERDEDGSRREFHVRPFLDEVQRTGSGVERRRPVTLVMVGGGEETWGLFEGAAREVGTESGGRWWFEGRDPRGHEDGEAQGERVEAGKDADGDEKAREERGEVHVTGGGLGIKRRYWFASNGIRIANLHVA